MAKAGHNERIPPIVVVGSKGTLGSLLLRELAMPRVGPGGVDAPLNVRGVEMRGGEVAAADAALLAEAQVVVNAGGPRVRPELTAGDYHREHVGIALEVARRMAPGARLVHLSSTAVFGVGRADVLGPASREAPERFPSVAYACAKHAAELAARAVAKERGVEVVVLRPSMVYGPGVESALDTLRGMGRRGVGLSLAPGRVRQHLTHSRVLVEAVRRAAVVPGPLPTVLLVVDPFVLTNADLRGRPSPGRALPAVPVPVPLPPLAKLYDLWAKVLPVDAPGALEAFAVLASDNVFDGDASFRILGLDPDDLGRGRTFEPYWEGTS